MAPLQDPTTDSLLITLSMQVLKEQYEGGYRQVIKDWQAADGDPTFWMFLMKNRLPKSLDKIVYVYWVLGGKIRWRCKYAGLEPTSKELWGYNWMLLFDFEKLPVQIPYKGFQGFRYYNSQP